MAKIIHTIIDSEGNVEVEFGGFSGTECLVEEDRFRRELASLGLRIDTTLQSGRGVSATHFNQIKPKRPANDLRSKS